MRLTTSEILKRILENHYEWCKANGRDTSWYKKDKEKKDDKKNTR